MPYTSWILTCIFPVSFLSLIQTYNSTPDSLWSKTRRKKKTNQTKTNTHTEKNKLKKKKTTWISSKSLFLQTAKSEKRKSGRLPNTENKSQVSGLSLRTLNKISPFCNSCWKTASGKMIVPGRALHFLRPNVQKTFCSNHSNEGHKRDLLGKKVKALRWRGVSLENFVTKGCGNYFFCL